MSEVPELSPKGYFSLNFSFPTTAPFRWWLMELPATVSFLSNWIVGWRVRQKQLRAKETRKQKSTDRGVGSEEGGPHPLVSAALLILWCRHYANRGWYFPLSIRVAKGTKASFALLNSVVGASFVALHGYLNARMWGRIFFTIQWQ